MFDNLILSLNTVTPVLILTLLGMFMKKIKLLPDSFYSAADKYVFNLALAALIFKQIVDADADKADTYIYAGVPGRVKAIYAEVNTAVADTMIRNGALCVLSLDGYMAVEVETDALAEGDTVTVAAPDGEFPIKILSVTRAKVNG